MPLLCSLLLWKLESMGMVEKELQEDLQIVQELQGN